jgi:hypothetical protein
LPCSHVKLPDGSVAIVKHAKRRLPRCKFCNGMREAALLCDFEIGRSLGGDVFTCDAPVCVPCARRVGEKDFCPKHPARTAGVAV